MAWKLRIIHGIYDRGFGRQDILELFRVTDRTMVLPPELDRTFRVSLQLYEEATMRYVTSIERLAKAEGREEGIHFGLEEGLRRALLSAILVRFDRVPEALRDGINGISNSDVLLRLHEVALRAESVEAFQQQMPND